MIQLKPASNVKTPVFVVGQDSRGNWVARDQSGTRGGLFVDRTQALRYVRSENEDRMQIVVIAAGPVELDMTGNRAAPPQQQLAVNAPDGRRVA